VAQTIKQLFELFMATITFSFIALIFFFAVFLGIVAKVFEIAFNNAFLISIVLLCILYTLA